MEYTIEKIAVLAGSIKYLEEKKRELERAVVLYKEDLQEEKKECEHEIVLFLGNDGMIHKMGPAAVYVCPICGRTYHKFDDTVSDNKDNPFTGSTVLDFSKNPSSFSTNNEGYILATRIRTLLIDTFAEDYKMDIEDFVDTIPSEWYIDPSFLKDKVKEHS